MRFRNWMAITTVVVFAASCGESSTKETSTTDTTGSVTTPVDNNTTNSTTNNTTQTVPAATVVVPEPTQKSFTTKYPNATNVSWNHYEPVSTFDWEWAGWPMMDTSDYVVRYNIDNNEYWTWYDNDNNWVATVSPVTDFAGLPAAVNKTIQKDFAGYTIVSVDKENDKNRTAYEVELAKGEEKVKALISESGTVIKKKGPEAK